MQVSIRGLSKSYGSTPALQDASLELAPGQIVALLGPNGAGKSTLLRCMAGIAGIDQGELLYDGEPFRRDRLDMRRRFYFMADTPYFNGGASVLRHIGIMLRVYECDLNGMEERVLGMLRELDLLPWVDTSLNKLSRGQAYKGALTALMAVNPELWLMDEPFASGMDPRGLTAFRAHARAAAKEGRTIIFSTQILEVAEQFADSVCILQNGRVHASGTIDELRRTANSTQVLEDLFAQLRETPA
jgi:ABC-type multidrug transport system ATPase subunit